MLDKPFVMSLSVYQLPIYRRPWPQPVAHCNGDILTQSCRYLGVGICWDQWFPEAARIMALQGAEILFYPTAIGSEPHDVSINSMRHWQNTQCGYAAANLMPLVASNRVGEELAWASSSITFYGHSFIAGPDGERVAEAGSGEGEILLASFDLDELAKRRRAWGVFRDRRVEHYSPLLTY